MEIKATSVQKPGENDRYVQTLLLCVILRTDTWQMREEDVKALVASSPELRRKQGQEIIQGTKTQTHKPRNKRSRGRSGLAT